jgi:hypothetical protein
VEKSRFEDRGRPDFQLLGVPLHCIRLSGRFGGDEIPAPPPWQSPANRARRMNFQLLAIYFSGDLLQVGRNLIDRHCRLGAFRRRHYRPVQAASHCHCN